MAITVFLNVGNGIVSVESVFNTPLKLSSVHLSKTMPRPLFGKHRNSHQPLHKTGVINSQSRFYGFTSKLASKIVNKNNIFIL